MPVHGIDALIIELPPIIDRVLFAADGHHVGSPSDRPCITQHGVYFAHVAYGAPEVGVPEVGAPEVGVAEVGVPEVGLVEVGVSEIGAPEIGAPEVGASEIGAPEIGAPEVGVAEVGVPEVGVPEVGAPEVGASEVGAWRDFMTVNFHCLLSVGVCTNSIAKPLPVCHTVVVADIGGHTSGYYRCSVTRRSEAGNTEGGTRGRAESVGVAEEPCSAGTEAAQGSGADRAMNRCAHCKWSYYKAASKRPGLRCSNMQTVYGTRGWACPVRPFDCPEFEREPGSDDEQQGNVAAEKNVAEEKDAEK